MSGFVLEESTRTIRTGVMRVNLCRRPVRWATLKAVVLAGERGIPSPDLIRTIYPPTTDNRLYQARRAAMGKSVERLRKQLQRESSGSLTISYRDHRYVLEARD